MSQSAARPNQHRVAAKRTRRAPAKRRAEPTTARRRSADVPPGPREREVKEKRLKRPAETTSLLAATAAVLVSMLGFEGPEAKEMTAALAGVLGVLPLAVSKFVDWKRERDYIQAERADLLERAVVALEQSVEEGTSKESVEAAAAALVDEVDE